MYAVMPHISIETPIFLEQINVLNRNYSGAKTRIELNNQFNFGDNLLGVVAPIFFFARYKAMHIFPHMCHRNCRQKIRRKGRPF